MSVSLCEYAHLQCGCPQRPEEGITTLANEVVGGCKPPDLYAEGQIQVGPL